MPKALLIDGHSLLFRAYYALPPLTSASGKPTGAVQGFLNMLLRLLEDQKPDYVACAFDTAEPTFRHEASPDYKSNRLETPEDFLPQVDAVQALLEALRIPVLTRPGFEADDILATLACKLAAEGVEVYLVSADRDLYQLLDGNIFLLVPKKGVGDLRPYDSAAFEQEYGFPPALVPDFKALSGDASDNIKGVQGVGPKTATKLIQQFGPVEQLLQRLDEVQPAKLQAKLEAARDAILRDKRLALVVSDLDLPVETSQLARTEPELPKLMALLEELDLRRLAGRFQRLFGAEAEPLALQVEEVGDASALQRLLATAEAVALALSEAGAPALALSADRTLLLQQAASEDLAGTLFAAEAPVEPWWRTALLDLLESSQRVFVFDLKAALRRLEAPPDFTPRNCFDLRLAAYLLEPDHAPQSFERLVSARLGLALEPGFAAKAFPSAGTQAPETAVALLAAALTWRLAGELEASLEKHDLHKVLDELELPLVPVLYSMEYAGFAVDREGLRAVSERLEALLQQVEAKAHSLVDEPFSLASPKQLQHILFDKLGLPKTRRTKTGYSTDAAELEKLADAHPLVPLILEYRNYSKLKSTYADALLELAEKSPDGRIHTTFNQTIAATGRLSSSDPNLQNLPQGGEWGEALRRCFIPSENGWLLLSADYSQIELRVLAHLSGEPNLIEAFQRGEDIHKRTAAEVFGVPPEQVTPELRSKAKMINFGLIYGMTEYGFAARLQVPVEEARAYIARYMARLPKVAEYLQRTLEEARRTGYVATLFGRLRWMPELQSANENARKAAERRAINMPVQGTAADLMKLAMINLHTALKGVRDRVKLLLQVHDELVLEVRESFLHEAAELLKHAMEDVYPLAVPLPVSLEAGPNWADQSPLD